MGNNEKSTMKMVAAYWNTNNRITLRLFLRISFRGTLLLFLAL